MAKLSKEAPAKLAKLNTGKGRAEATPDQLKNIRKLAERARDLERVIEEREEALQALREEHRDIYFNKLPTAMQEANVDTLGIPAKGNLPAMDLELKPYYSASIAASWPDEKRKKAFDYLIKIGAEDLIKTDVVASFGRGNINDAKKLTEQLAKKKNVSATLKETVHSGTLGAWLRDQVENHNFTPNLELIGGSMGYVVKPKARKE